MYRLAFRPHQKPRLYCRFRCYPCGLKIRVSPVRFWPLAPFLFYRYPRVYWLKRLYARGSFLCRRCPLNCRIMQGFEHQSRNFVRNVCGLAFRPNPPRIRLVLYPAYLLPSGSQTGIWEPEDMYPELKSWSWVTPRWAVNIQGIPVSIVFVNCHYVGLPQVHKMVYRVGYSISAGSSARSAPVSLEDSSWLSSDGSVFFSSLRSLFASCFFCFAISFCRFSYP